MSVLRSKRKVAKSEYEHSFAELYQFSMKQTSRVPKRRGKWLCDAIDIAMNDIYLRIMHIGDSYFSSKDERKKYVSNEVVDIISLLNALEKPLMILWNIQRYEVRAMAQWVTKIKLEVSLLNQMHDSCNIGCAVSILDWQAINNAKFLKNMSELHRYTHGKVTNAPAMYDGTYGSLLIQIVDNAFYELILANKSIPKTKVDYEQRKRHISSAITYLNEMNRPLLFYFNLMQYSERVMVEWAEMLTNEIKMLSSLQRSDRARFKHLN